jgi:hypothetical protein
MKMNPRLIPRVTKTNFNIVLGLNLEPCSHLSSACLAKATCRKCIFRAISNLSFVNLVNTIVLYMALLLSRKRSFVTQLRSCINLITISRQISIRQDRVSITPLPNVILNLHKPNPSSEHLDSLLFISKIKSRRRRKEHESKG